jgi:hypothetical protein
VTELHTILWRRLDTPGHDVCRVEPSDEGWRLDGVAVFLHEGSPARLAYGVGCDAAWRTLDGFVRGFVGNRVVDIAIERRPHGGWIVDRRPVPGFDHCEHLDFGFTPATNIPQVRSLALADGAAADLPVLWQDVPPASVQLLPQRYERRGDAMWYDAPTLGYRGLLELTSDGIVRVYPGLWELEAAT